MPHATTSGSSPYITLFFEGKFIFASEIKAILEYPSAHSACDEQSLQQYLAFQFCLGEKTLFNGIYKVQPGHFLSGTGACIEIIPAIGTLTIK